MGRPDAGGSRTGALLGGALMRICAWPRARRSGREERNGIIARDQRHFAKYDARNIPARVPAMCMAISLGAAIRLKAITTPNPKLPNALRDLEGHVTQQRAGGSYNLDRPRFRPGGYGRRYLRS